MNVNELTGQFNLTDLLRIPLIAGGAGNQTAPAVACGQTSCLALWEDGPSQRIQGALMQILPLTVLGPAPCPLVRIKDRWRWHVLLKGPSESLGRVVRYAARRLKREGKTRVVIDRDPVSLL